MPSPHTLSLCPFQEALDQGAGPQLSHTGRRRETAAPWGMCAWRHGDKESFWVVFSFYSLQCFMV